MVFDYSFNTHKLGRDDNRWYGKVVDAKHWKPQNDLFMITGLPNARVKVRIIGADPETTTEMGDEDTRWALVSQPAGVGGGSGGRGETISYVGGETVFGFYLDGPNMQFPIITGSIMPAAKTAKNEKKVLFKLAWGFKSLYKNYITIIGANGKIEVKFIFSKFNI